MKRDIGNEKVAVASGQRPVLRYICAAERNTGHWPLTTDQQVLLPYNSQQ